MWGRGSFRPNFLHGVMSGVNRVLDGEDNVKILYMDRKGKVIITLTKVQPAPIPQSYIFDEYGFGALLGTIADEKEIQVSINTGRRCVNQSCGHSEPGMINGCNCYRDGEQCHCDEAVFEQDIPKVPEELCPVCGKAHSPFCCPYCGGEAIVCRRKNGRYVVKCKKYIRSDKGFLTKEQAVKGWNRRQTPGWMEAVLELLRDIIAELGCQPGESQQILPAIKQLKLKAERPPLGSAIPTEMLLEVGQMLGVVFGHWGDYLDAIQRLIASDKQRQELQDILQSLSDIKALGIHFGDSYHLLPERIQAILHELDIAKQHGKIVLPTGIRKWLEWFLANNTMDGELNLAVSDESLETLKDMQSNPSVGIERRQALNEAISILLRVRGE